MSELIAKKKQNDQLKILNDFLNFFLNINTNKFINKDTFLDLNNVLNEKDFHLGGINKIAIFEDFVIILYF